MNRPENARLKEATKRDMAKIHELVTEFEAGQYDAHGLAIAAYIIGGHIPLDEQDRQAFIDEAAIATMASLVAAAAKLFLSPDEELSGRAQNQCARMAHDAAEALWAERERRREK